MKLQAIEAEAYARDVLPLTASLWAEGRPFDLYAEQVTAIAHCGYGRRHYRTVGLYDGDRLVSSFKRYQRVLHVGGKRLRAVGIAAVFTQSAYRSRGYASAMLAMELDRSRVEGFDFAYLFSDIRPQFYIDLGFVELPSHSISLRADSLTTERVEVQRLEESDWPGVERCFELSERQRPWGFVRTPLVWDWVRLRIEQGAEHPGFIETNLVVRRGRGIAAYVLGARAPEQDAYVLDEFGFADAAAAATIPALLRSAAGDLRRIIGWLPPDFARDRLARASVRRRSKAVFMAASFTSAARKWLSLASESGMDGVWSTDHI